MGAITIYPITRSRSSNQHECPQLIQCQDHIIKKMTEVSDALWLWFSYKLKYCVRKCVCDC